MNPLKITYEITPEDWAEALATIIEIECEIGITPVTVERNGKEYPYPPDDDQIIELFEKKLFE